jgi:hypothetical protein
MLAVRLSDILISMQMTGDVAACVYYMGIDPFTKQEAYVARGMRDRRMQRALMQFFKPTLQRIGPGGSCGTIGGVRGCRKRIGPSRRHVGTSGDTFVSALFTGNEWVPVPADLAVKGFQAGELFHGSQSAGGGRPDLISGCEGLISAQPPREAIEGRRRRANEAARGDHYHSVANPSKGAPVRQRGLPNHGYRPGRKTAHRQDKKRKRKDGGSGPRP